MSKTTKTIIDARTGKPLTKATVAERFDEKEPTLVEGIPNIHPADELAAIREEIKQLQDRADELRDWLLAQPTDLKGDQYVAAIVPGVRESLDRKAITEAFGEKAIAPFVKKTNYQTVKLVER